MVKFTSLISIFIVGLATASTQNQGLVEFLKNLDQGTCAANLVTGEFPFAGSTLKMLNNSGVGLSQLVRAATFEDLKPGPLGPRSRIFKNENGVLFLDREGTGIMRIKKLDADSKVENEVLIRSREMGGLHEVGKLVAYFLLPSGEAKRIEADEFVDGQGFQTDIGEVYARFLEKLKQEGLLSAHPMIMRYVHLHNIYDFVTHDGLMLNALNEVDFGSAKNLSHSHPFIVEAVVPNGYKYSTFFLSENGKSKNVTLGAMAKPEND
jgi:hypothetical protein